MNKVDFIIEVIGYEDLENMVRECNSYDDSLESFRMDINDDEFFSVYFEGRPMEVARAICYGDYKFMDEYVTFNAYENLVSYSEYEYHELLEENQREIIERYLEMYEDNQVHGDLDYDVQEIVEADVVCIVSEGTKILGVSFAVDYVDTLENLVESGLINDFEYTFETVDDEEYKELIEKHCKHTVEFI